MNKVKSVRIPYVNHQRYLSLVKLEKIYKKLLSAPNFHKSAFLRKQCVNKLFEFTYFRYLSVFEILCYLMATCNSYFTP